MREVVRLAISSRITGHAGRALYTHREGLRYRNGMLRSYRFARWLPACLGLVLLVALALPCFADTYRLPWVKPRVIVETDAPGGDPDDEGSLVRFFLYMNEWDTEALIGTRSAADSRLGISGKARLMQFVGDYASVRPTLSKHADGYPLPNDLRKRVFQSYEGTEARDAVIAILEADDPRPVWYQDWGTNEDDGVPTALRQALDYLQANRSPAVYRALAARVHYVEVYLRDFAGPHRHALGFYMDTFWPDMDGGRWYHRWRPLTLSAGGMDIDRDIRQNHGPLTANYTIPKEGDTMAFMHLIPNGLHDPMHPEWGSWSGRYSFNPEFHMWWCDRQDSWNGSTSRDNTLARWAEHIQNDFRARADWCVRESRDQANHEPKPVLNGDHSRDVLVMNVAPGSTVTLSAEGSSDPDSNQLRYRWIYYPEAGSYGKPVNVQQADRMVAQVTIPEDAGVKTIHIVLQVTDNGSPALTRYRRAILQGTPPPGWNR